MTAKEAICSFLFAGYTDTVSVLWGLLKRGLAEDRGGWEEPLTPELDLPFYQVFPKEGGDLVVVRGTSVGDLRTRAAAVFVPYPFKKLRNALRRKGRILNLTELPGERELNPGITREDHQRWEVEVQEVLASFRN